MSVTGTLRQAWGLFRSDSRAETYVAVVILVTAFGPVLVQLWELKRQVGGEHAE